MRGLAPAKVNLSLFLGGVRKDGRHELVTVFESVSLADEVSVSLSVDGGRDQVVCPGVSGPNLVSSALAALRQRGWDAPPVRVEIVKRIPVAAGLGGGSADAACLLRLADGVAPLPAGLDLSSLASSLGADVPSQLEPGLSLGTGAGDVVAAREPLEAHAFLIVPQSFGLSTAAVYAEADRLGLGRSGEELEAALDDLCGALAPGARLPSSLMVNDLEPATISLASVVGDALEAVRSCGAEEAFVCGSGPTVAGLWWGPDAASRADVAAAALSARFPGVTAATPAIHSFRHNSDVRR